MAVVRLRVSSELDSIFQEDGPRILGGVIVGRELDTVDFCFVYRLDMPHAPADAVEMFPTFRRGADGEFSVQSYGWRRADGTPCDRAA